MTPIYGCVVCLTPRTDPREWDWIVGHRAECPGAVWGTWQEQT